MSKARSTGNIGNIIKTSATCVTVNDGTTDLLIMSGSGTVTIPGNLVVLGGIAGSSAESSSYSLSSSFATNANTLDGIDGASFLQTGSFNTFSSSIDTTIKNKLNGDGVISGSVQVDITNTTGYSTFSSSLSSSIGSLSGSVATTTSGLSSSIGSLSSSVATNTSGLAGRIGTIEGNYATTGSNIFVGSQVITGSLYITNDMVVQGCSCLQNITASAVSIGTNVVMLNTATPAVRFAGISVQDSGSNAGVTGSIYWDGLCNKWIYSNPSTVGYTGGMLISGPRNTGTIGSESPLTCNYIAKSGGGDHIYDSCIIDDGTTVCVNATLKASGQVCGVMGSFSCMGVGTETPSGKLNVVATGADGIVLSPDTGDSNNSGRIFFVRTGGEGWAVVNNSGILSFRSSAIPGNTSGNQKLGITTDGVATFLCQVCTPHLVGSNNVSIGGNCTVTSGYNTRLRITNIANDSFVFAFNNQACKPIMYMYGGNTVNPQGYTAWLDNTTDNLNHIISHNTAESTYFASQGGNVGIGTSSLVTTCTNGALTIVKKHNLDTPPSVTAQCYYCNQSGLYIFGRNSGISLISSTNEESRIQFAGPSSEWFATIGATSLNSAVGGTMYFRTGGSNSNRLSIDNVGVSSFSCQVCAPFLSVGDGTQCNHADAPLTIKRGAGGFAGLDFKSLRTEGNIGGARFYDCSGTVQSQLLVEVDGSFNFYNATSSNRLKITSTGIACFACQVCAPTMMIANCLGIGGTPLAELFIGGGSMRIDGTTPFIYLRGGSTGAKGAITFNHYGYTDFSINAGCSGNYILGITRTPGGTDGILLHCNGNVGIGRAPSYKLDVNGGIRVSDGGIQMGPLPIQYPYARLDSYEHDGTGFFWGLGVKSNNIQKINAFFVGAARTFHAVDDLKVVSWVSNEFNGSYPSYSVPINLHATSTSYINTGAQFLIGRSSFCSSFSFANLETSNGQTWLGPLSLGNSGAGLEPTPFYCGGGKRWGFGWNSGELNNIANYNHCTPFLIHWGINGDNPTNDRKFCFNYNGQAYSTSGTWGTISSNCIIKEGITVANSQWNDIKNICIVNYKMKEEIEEFGSAARLHLGVVAEQVAEVSPGLLEEGGYSQKWCTCLNGVKTSILHMKAVKALQEAMCRIEILETCLGIN